MSDKALLVIDVQQDYFPGGGVELWNTEAVLKNVVAAIEKARSLGIAVVHIQHVSDTSRGRGSSFFNAGTEGVKIHPAVLAAAPEAPVVVKHYADGFYETRLEEVLSGLGVKELLVCGMMTQNCVTHTAISKSAEKYDKVTVLSDCCTTVSQLIHLTGLNALSIRVELKGWQDAF